MIDFYNIAMYCIGKFSFYSELSRKLEIFSVSAGPFQLTPKMKNRKYPESPAKLKISKILLINTGL